jgi:hypothetical protein
MQTLVFDTTNKKITLYSGQKLNGSDIIIEKDNVPTVKVLDNYYEVMQKDEMDKQLPVLRLGIQSTNMIIKK